MRTTRFELLLCCVLVALPLWPADLGAQVCNRRCAASTPRDAHGCCVVKSKKTPKPRSGPRSTVRKKARCPEGKKLLAGHCCWPGQDWGASSKRCLGEPQCPNGFLPRGKGCVPGCVGGKKRVAGHCCWPGQDWGSSGNRCVGTPRCAAGRVLSADRRDCISDPARITWIMMVGGSFEMGVKDSRDRGPQRTIELDSFAISRSEITVAQYQKCVKQKACGAPRGGRPICNSGRKGRASHPINCVDWKQASAFCAWAGGALPTEAQWEYAARSGGKERRYPWGTASPDCDRVVKSGRGANCATASSGTSPVCSRSTGNTTHGLCDMSGNVNEWVRDWHARPYSMLESKNPVGPPRGKSKVLRGGDWRQGAERLFETTSRNSIYSTHHWDWVGFRCVRAPGKGNK